MRTELDHSVIDFVAERTGVAPEQLLPHVTLYGDLGIAGADGLELIEEFGRTFHLDMSDFNPARHFGPEGLPLHAPIVWIWWIVSAPFRQKQTPEQRAGLIPVRISDLIRAAEEGRWRF